MKLKTFFSLLASGQTALLYELQNNFIPYYRSLFLASALTSGIYARLHQGPASLAELQDCLGAKDASEQLEAWLELGVNLGELKRNGAVYALRSRLSRALARPASDPQAALLQEAVSLHYDLITQTPQRLVEQRLFTLADSDGELIARSSRILEPFMFEMVESVLPAQGAFHLLEVGCGSGVYLAHACRRNPELTALGLELQPQVAAFARQNLADWGIGERVRVECADVREYASQERFDLVTLHNNIYYFPEAERLVLLQHLASFLKPGGRLLVTTGCQGGGVTMQALNLWALMTEGAGKLPQVEAFCDLLRQAGFASVQKTNLMPGNSFYGFVAGNFQGAA